MQLLTFGSWCKRIECMHHSSSGELADTAMYETHARKPTTSKLITGTSVYTNMNIAIDLFAYTVQDHILPTIAYYHGKYELLETWARPVSRTPKPACYYSFTGTIAGQQQSFSQCMHVRFIRVHITLSRCRHETLNHFTYQYWTPIQSV